MEERLNVGKWNVEDELGWDEPVRFELEPLSSFPAGEVGIRQFSERDDRSNMVQSIPINSMGDGEHLQQLAGMALASGMLGSNVSGWNMDHGDWRMPGGGVADGAEYGGANLTMLMDDRMNGYEAPSWTAQSLSQSSTEGSEKSKSSGGKKRTRGPAEELNSKKGINMANKNAEHCRKHREKRRREEQNIRHRNEELESERELFLARIADLETEVASLRGGGQVDIEKENELLRAEIRKYKGYVENIVRATVQATQVTPEEQYRVLRSFLDNGCAQIVGLAYTSQSDPSWSKAKPLLYGGHKLHVWFQYLPQGTEIRNAHRLNIRVDVFGLPVSRIGIKDKVWKIFSNPEVSNQFFNKEHAETVRRTVYETKLPAGVAKIREQQNQEDIKIMRFVTSNPTKASPTKPESLLGEFIAVTSYKETPIYPCAYEKYEKEGLIPARDEKIGDQKNDNPDSAYVFVLSSCSTTLEKANLSESIGSGPSDIVRIDAPLLVGCMCRERKDAPGKCDMTMVGSYPVGDKHYKETEGLGLNSEPPVNEKGELSGKYIADLTISFSMVLAQL